MVWHIVPSAVAELDLLIPAFGSEHHDTIDFLDIQPKKSFHYVRKALFVTNTGRNIHAERR